MVVIRTSRGRTTFVLRVGLMLATVLCLSCGSSKPAPRSLPYKAQPELKNGAKLVAYYNAQRNRSFYRNEGLKFTSNISAKGGKTEQSHAFEINCTAESEGNGTRPSMVTLELIHDIETKSKWHFDANTKFRILADGTEFASFECLNDCFSHNPIDGFHCCQAELTKDDPKDRTYYEALFFDLNTDVYANLCKAKSVEVQVNNGSFDLPEPVLVTLRDFNEILGP
jgi:hypothetical protein